MQRIFQIKARDEKNKNKNKIWSCSEKKEMPQARGESDNLKDVIEFPSLLEAHNTSENFRKSINHPIKEN